MNHIDILLAKKIIPIVQHSSYWFDFATDEARKAANGLMPGVSVNFFVAKSARKNAFSFKAGQEFFIVFTNGLFEFIEKSTAALLNTEAVRQFFRDWMHVDYQVIASVPQDMTWAAAPPDEGSREGASAWLAVFERSFEWALIFVMLHEIAHIKLGHIDGGAGDSGESSGDLYGMTVRAVELMTYGGEGENRFTRYNEYCADREAAGWLFQLATKKGARDPAVRRAEIGLASFGLLVAVLHLSRHVASAKEIDQSFDHVSFDARLESAWEGIDFALKGILMEVSALKDIHTHTRAYANASFDEQMIMKQREVIEALVLGAPSYYWITL